MFIPCMRHQKLRLAGAERRGVEDIRRWNIDGCIILRAISERDKMEMERIEAGMSGEKEKETRERDALISRYPPPLPPSFQHFSVLNIAGMRAWIFPLLIFSSAPYYSPRYVRIPRITSRMQIEKCCPRAAGS